MADSEERLPLVPFVDELHVGEEFKLRWTGASNAFPHWPWTLQLIEGGKFHFENRRSALLAVLRESAGHFVVDSRGEPVEVRRA